MTASSKDAAPQPEPTRRREPHSVEWHRKHISGLVKELATAVGNAVGDGTEGNSNPAETLTNIFLLANAAIYEFIRRIQYGAIRFGQDTGAQVTIIRPPKEE